MTNTIVVSTREESVTGNYWLIRSGVEAEYFEHFKSKNVIAIGHTSGIEMDCESGEEISTEKAEELIRLYTISLQNKNKSKAVVTTQTHQVRRFIQSIKVGDHVITISKSTVIVGKVTSKAYYSTEPIQYQSTNLEDNDYNCEFPLRIKVDWGKRQARLHMPYIIEKSFRNTGTLSQITDEDKIKAINHWLQPIHFADGEVRCSVNIQSSEDLLNKPLTNLSNVLDQLELLSHYLSTSNNLDSINIETYIQYSQDQISSPSYTYKLTAQHAFMSPGHQFIQLSGGTSQKQIFAIGFALLFNTQVTFAEEAIPDPVLTAKIIQLVEHIKTVEVFNALDKLEAKLPKQSMEAPVREAVISEPSASSNTVL